MKRDNTTLKTYFETGDYPTQGQFADLIDSFLNIDEEDAVTGITNNGDGTYTFQLLSGTSETLDVQSLPNDIPIANIIGLQAALDARDPNGFVKNDSEISTADGSFVLGTQTGGIGYSLFSNNNAGSSLPVSYSGIFSFQGDSDGRNFAFLKANDGQNSNSFFVGLADTNGVLAWRQIWHSGSDGAGSGLDADTLDGVQGSNFLRSDTDDTMNGILTVGNRIKTSRIDTNSGQQLVLNAGESAGQATGQTNEYIYLNSEQGIEINSTPDNWASGWSGRETTKISGSEIQLKSSNTRLSPASGNSLRIDTGTGYIEVGSKNTSHCHFYTDRSNFYFNKELRVDSGIFSSYNEDLILTRAGSSEDRFRVTTGYCISDQNFLIYGRGAQALTMRAYSNNANTPCYLRFEKLDGTDRSYIGYGSSSNSHLYIVNQEGTDCYLMLKTNGEAEFNNNVRADNFILSSDRRLKTNIKPLNKSMNLDFVEFEMNKNKGEKRYGVIAQEVEEKHPELVFTDEEGMKQVKYIDLLVAKIAELEKRIAMLEKN